MIHATDCVALDVPRPALVVDGDNLMLVLPEKYAELAPTLAKLLSAAPFVAEMGQ